MISFGPVPSRRLGRSLGINNIPPKVCTYSCVYCQVGRITKMQVNRHEFYPPEEVFGEVQQRVGKTNKSGCPIDYLTFVSDGEPTLDAHLGDEINLLKSLGLKIAVITNAALIWRPDVRMDLEKADWVSLKVDGAGQEVWRRINRPHGKLELGHILHGALEFAKHYKGKLVTETMLVHGVNDQPADLAEIGDILAALKPSKSYLSIPTRPPAEKWVMPPDEEKINSAYQILAQNIDRLECLVGYEGNAFAYTGNLQEDILSITAVHPMREDAVMDFLHRAKAGWSEIQRLIEKGQLVETKYGQYKFLVRKLPQVDQSS
jgi:wyosine [tRNA(Phe)-imidazoG37] synthetase (radical SAM superfamily)